MSFFSDKTPAECWVYFDRHLALIPDAANGAEARRYLREREEKVKLSTVGSYLGHIKAFGIFLGAKRWRDATRDDVIDHIKAAVGRQGRAGRVHPSHGKPLGRYTKYQRMVMLREFYKWLLDVEHPAQFARMPFEKPSMEEQSLAREDRLSKEEVMDLLSAAPDARDRCVVMFLLDSGYRAGEAAAIDLGDIVFDEYGAKARHSSSARGLKTLRRKVPTRLTLSAPYLREWISRHPSRLRPGSPLFPSRSNRNFGERLKASGIWSIVTRLARRAKMRHVHPHLFRHTAASLRAADGWGEEMMRLHFGWSKGSDMPSLYSNVEQDYDSFALRRAGLPVPREKVTWTVQCAGCKAESPGDAYFCGGCGNQLVAPPDDA